MIASTINEKAISHEPHLYLKIEDAITLTQTRREGWAGATNSRGYWHNGGQAALGEDIGFF